MSSKDTSSKDTSSKDTSSKDTSSKDTSSKDTSFHLAMHRRLCLHFVCLRQVYVCEALK